MKQHPNETYGRREQGWFKHNGTVYLHGWRQVCTGVGERPKGHPMTPPDAAALVAASTRELSKLHIGLVLDSLPDDAARAAQCRKWQAAARNKFFQGQAETVSDILLSREERYQGMGVAARTVTGQRRWAGMTVAKEFIGEEEMFGRWAVMYSLAAMEGRAR